MKNAEGLGGNWEIRNSRMYFFLRIMKKDKTEVDILKDTSLTKVTLDCLYSL